MRRWLHECIDEAFLPLLKVAARGYKERLPAYRPPGGCDISHLANLTAPADVKLHRGPDWRGAAVEKIQFTSPVVCRHPTNNTVNGLLLRTDSNAPWVLIVPGYATGAVPPFGYGVFQEVHGRAALDAGLNVALFDLPFHLERKPQGGLSGEGFFSPDLAQTQNAVVQAVGDTICLVRYLQERYQQPVALWGTSLGGCIAGLAASMVDDLSALVLMEPLDNPGDALAHLPACADIRERLCLADIYMRSLPELFSHLAPSTYQPKVDRDHILFVTPLWDRVVPTRFQETFWQAWGRPRRINMATGHVGLHTDRNLPAKVADFIWRRSRVG